MQSKLTLSIDKQVIERAKEFARLSNRSLSDIIETYLKRITNSEMKEVDHELSNIVGVITLPENFDEKEEVRRIVSTKHL